MALLSVLLFKLWFILSAVMCLNAVYIVICLFLVDQSDHETGYLLDFIVGLIHSDG